MKKRAARHLARIAFLFALLSVGMLFLIQIIPGVNFYPGDEASFVESVLGNILPANMALVSTGDWAEVIILPIFLGVLGLTLILWLIHHVTLIAKHRGDQWGLSILFLLGGLVSIEVLLLAFEPGFMYGADLSKEALLMTIIQDSENPFWAMLLQLLPFVFAAIAVILFFIGLFISFGAMSRRGAKKDSEYDVYKLGRKLNKAHRGANDDLNQSYVERDEMEGEPKKSYKDYKREKKAARNAVEREEPTPVVAPAPAPVVVARVPATPAPAATDVDASKALDNETLADEEPKAASVQPAPAPTPIIQYFGYGFGPEFGSGPKKEEKGLTADDIRAVIAEELAKVQPAPTEEGLKEEDVKEIVAEELGKLKEEEAERKLLEEQRAEALANQIKEQDEKIASLEAKIVPAEVIRQILAEELAKVQPAPAPEPEPEPAPEPEPEPVVVAEAPAPEPEPGPVVVAEAPAPEPEPEPVVVAEAPAPEPAPARIPFATRLLAADDELRENYNELKAECLSYGLKSRLSNSGDTFRLHTKTYVKITVAGKGLKLYFALDPKDYENTPITLKDVGSKNVYKEIPACFKVKSGLAMRRAKQLLADACAKDGLVQGLVEEHNFARDLKDYKPQNSVDDDIEEDE